MLAAPKSLLTSLRRSTREAGNVVANGNRCGEMRRRHDSGLAELSADGAQRRGADVVHPRGHVQND